MDGLNIQTNGKEMKLPADETIGFISCEPSGEDKESGTNKGPRLSRTQILDSIGSGCLKVKSNVFNRRRLPAIDWARSYNMSKFSDDCIAGLTTALTAIPQGIGYAPLAGLPLQYGLYAAIIPGFVYALLGTCKETTVGTTAPNALLSYNYAGSSIIHALTLSFFAGIVEITAGLLNLGFLVNYISAPVISAFTAAVAIQVVTSQVKGLLGLQVPGRGFIGTWKGVLQNINQIRIYDAVLGFSCIGILLFLRKLKSFHWLEGDDPESQRAKVLQKIKWSIANARNCLVVIISTLIAYVLINFWNLNDVFILTGEVNPGLPAFQLPWQPRESGLPTANISLTDADNALEVTISPVKILQDLGMGLILLPLVSIMPQAAMAQFYAAPGARVDISQEILALGSSQLLGSFVGSMAVTASVGRSAVNAASGVKTPFGGIITSIIVIVACAFLTPYFAYIPTTAVAAVIIAAMIFTLELEILLPIWKSKKIDLVPYIVTLGVGVFVSVEMGMIVGTLVHLSILLYSSTTPKIQVNQVQGELCDYFLVYPDRGLFFPSVDQIRNYFASKTSQTKTTTDKVVVNVEDVESCISTDGPQRKCPDPLPIIIDLSRVTDVDYTAAVGILTLTKSLKKSGRGVYFCGASPSVESVLKGVDPTLFISYANIHEAENKIIQI